MPLQLQSLAARGLWAEMLCIMHLADRRGHLEIQGYSIQAPGLARLVGATEEEVQQLLDELEAAGIFSRKPDNTIYSRRMVRDAKLSEVRRAAGTNGAAVRYGAGKDEEAAEEPTEFAIAKDITSDQQNCDTDTGINNTTKGVAKKASRKKPKVDEAPLSIPDELVEAWQEYIEYRKVQHAFKYKAVKYEQQALDNAIEEAGGDLEAVKAAIKTSIAAGWRGLFPAKETSRAHGHSKETASGTGGRNYNPEDYL